MVGKFGASLGKSRGGSHDTLLQSLFEHHTEISDFPGKVSVLRFIEDRLRWSWKLSRFLDLGWLYGSDVVWCEF